jgi:hypothetical protein
MRYIKTYEGLEIKVGDYVKIGKDHFKDFATEDEELNNFFLTNIAKVTGFSKKIGNIYLSYRTVPPGRFWALDKYDRFPVNISEEFVVLATDEEIENEKTKEAADKYNL